MALAGAGPEAVEPLIRALRDRDPKVRGGAARALETLGARAKAAVPALIAALTDPEPPDDPKPPRGPSFDDWQREGEPRPSGYYAALCAIGPPAVPVLLERLNAPDRQARVVALRALGFLGDDAKSSVPRLIALLRDPDLRGEAASALGGIGARDAIPALLARLKDLDPGFRACAAETLGRIGWERQAVQYSSRTIARGAIRPLAAARRTPPGRPCRRGQGAEGYRLGVFGGDPRPGRRLGRPRGQGPARRRPGVRPGWAFQRDVQAVRRVHEHFFQVGQAALPFGQAHDDAEMLFAFPQFGGGLAGQSGFDDILDVADVQAVAGGGFAVNFDDGLRHFARAINAGGIHAPHVRDGGAHFLGLVRAARWSHRQRP